MKLNKLFGILFILCIVGCVTTSSSVIKIPVGCENSVLWKYKDQVDFTMQTAITGLKIYAIYNPADYAIAQSSAKNLITFLKQGSLSYDDILKNNNSKELQVVNIIITTYYKPGQIIDKCLLELLINYLEMI